MTSSSSHSHARHHANNALSSSQTPVFLETDISLSLATFGLSVPAKQTSRFRNLLGKERLLKRPNVNPVQVSEHAPDRRILLISVEYASLSELLSAMPVESTSIIKDAIDTSEVEVIQPYEVNVPYDALTMQECLRQIIPLAEVKDDDLQGSFELVGRVAHVNLRDALLPYKRAYGKVLADKNPRVEIVVNKTSATKNEFRVFPMEVIHGPPCINEDDGKLSLVTEVKQGRFKYQLDYARVYWNSRLEREHARLCETHFLREPKRGGQVVLADLYCGIGPFVVPAASSDGTKGGCNCLVYANDLNPDSVKWLKENLRRNKCSSNVAEASVDDAVLYARKLVRRGIRFDHAVMNLPALAVDHLVPAFQGILNFDELATDAGSEVSQVATAAWDGWQDDPPWIHCYCFVRGKTSSGGLGDGTGKAAAAREVEHVRDAKRLVMHRLCIGTPAQRAAKRQRADDDDQGGGGDFEATYAPEDLESIDADEEARFECKAHVVRNVAPGKIMVCVSFPLPVEVASTRSSPGDVLARL